MGRNIWPEESLLLPLFDFCQPFIIIHYCTDVNFYQQLCKLTRIPVHRYQNSLTWIAVVLSCTSSTFDKGLDAVGLEWPDAKFGSALTSGGGQPIFHAEDQHGLWTWCHTDIDVCALNPEPRAPNSFISKWMLAKSVVSLDNGSPVMSYENKCHTCFHVQKANSWFWGMPFPHSPS